MIETLCYGFILNFKSVFLCGHVFKKWSNFLQLCLFFKGCHLKIVDERDIFDTDPMW